MLAVGETDVKVLGVLDIHVWGTGDGDNYGETNQLEDCWYTYEASL